MTKAKYPIRRYSIQRFLGCTDGPTFHEPVFLVYERELLALETKLEAAERILETQAAMFKNYEALAAAQEEET